MTTGFGNMEVIVNSNKNSCFWSGEAKKYDWNKFKKE